MANAKYEISHNGGTTWSPISRREARRCLTKTTHEPTLELIVVDKGKISNMMGWGLLRRKPGRWNSKAELDAKTLKHFTKYMLLVAGLGHIHETLHMAVREKDRKAVMKEAEKQVDAEMAKMKSNSKFEKYIKKVRKYSP